MFNIIIIYYSATINIVLTRAIAEIVLVFERKIKKSERTITVQYQNVHYSPRLVVVKK